MLKYRHFTLLIIVFLFFKVAISFSQDKCISKAITDLYTAFPTDLKNCIHSNKSSGKSCLHKKNKIHSVYSKDILTHAGIAAFKSYPEKDKEILFYLERILLEIDLCKNESEIKKITTDNKLEFTLNGVMFGNKTFNSAQSLFNAAIPNESYTIKTDTSAVYLKMINSQKQILICKLPVNYLQIMAMDKKEADAQVAHSLKNYSAKMEINKDNVLSEYKHFKKHDSSNELKKDSLFTGLLNRIFVQNTKPDELVFSENNMLASINNFFTLPFFIKNNATLAIAQKAYGNEQIEYNITLDSFFEYYNSAFNSYTAIQEESGDALTITIVLKHKYLQTLNMLIIKTNKKDIFVKDAVFKATFFANIPSDNIKNIFATYLEKDKKLQYQVK